MATPTVERKLLPGFRCIIDDGPNVGGHDVIISDEQRAQVAQFMQERGLKSIPDGGCRFSPLPASKLREALDDLSAQHSRRLREMEADGRLVVK